MNNFEKKCIQNGKYILENFQWNPIPLTFDQIKVGQQYLKVDDQFNTLHLIEVTEQRIYKFGSLIYYTIQNPEQPTERLAWVNQDIVLWDFHLKYGYTLFEIVGD